MLDVGCGKGEILRGLREAGVPATGLEAQPGLAEELCREGFDVEQGSAEALPFADGAFDWVAMRHVAHHLADPRRAVGEAARVAARGVVVAEPWHHRAFPEQDLDARITAWMKRQDRRLGREHHADLGAAELLALFPDGWATSAEIECVLRLAPRPLEELRARMEPLLEGLPEDHPDRTEWSALLEEARNRGVGYNGSTIVVASHRP